MAPRHPASETAGQRAQAHDVDDSPLNTAGATAHEKSAKSSKSKSDPTNKENVIR